MSDTNFTREYNFKDPVCLHKLAWSTIFLNKGTSASCHRVVAEPLTVDNFDNFHNTPASIDSREKMQAGIWPGNGCEACRDLEAVGGASDRVRANNSPIYERFVPNELKDNPLATSVTPSMVEVYFSNRCNMACVYCNWRVSSLWEKELKRNDLLSESELKEIATGKENYAELKDKFWGWMFANAHAIREYKILGGEPFYQSEIWDNITFFKRQPCPDTDVTIFSNLKVSTDKFETILSEFDQMVVDCNIRSFTLFASIDGLGPEAEYVRYGLNSEQWKDNYELFISKFPKIKLYIHFTMSALNIKAAKELVDYINDNPADNVKLSFSVVDSLEHFHPGIFPKGFFDKDMDALIDAVQDELARKKLIAYKDLFNSKKANKAKRTRLREVLEGIDERRFLDWKETFPWLIDKI